MSEQLRRAADLLELLAREPDRSVRALADVAGLSKSATHRVLAGLVETGLAEQDGAGRYRLGARTLALGTAYRRRLDLRALALPHMARLRDVTGETVGLSVPMGDELVHVEQAVSTSELRRVFEIGRPLPLWCGAPSRIVLAHRDPADVRRLAASRDDATITPADPPDVPTLLAAVELCRHDGFAVALGETIAGVNTVAVAVLDATGGVHATLSVTGPASRWDTAAMRARLPELRAAASTLSQALGAD